MEVKHSLIFAIILVSISFFVSKVLALSCNEDLDCPSRMRCERPTCGIDVECGEGICVDVGCVGEDEKIPSMSISPDYREHMATECCEGLTAIAWPKIYDENCDFTGIVGYPVGVCTKCGNGVCKYPETKCNCPEDCDVELILNDSYNEGESIEIKVKNNRNESIYYDASGCGPTNSYYIEQIYAEIAGIERLQILNPCSICPTVIWIEEIESGETKTIDTWDQKKHKASTWDECDCESDETCGESYVNPGTFTITFKYNTQNLAEFPPNPKETEEIISKEFQIEDSCPDYYTCPDGTEVPWCVLENSYCVCIISPENQCPSVTTTTTVTSITYEGDGTYVLNVGDSIETSNGYLVELTLALGEFGSRSDWRTDINIYDPNGELIKNHISWGNGTIDIDHITIKYERYEEGKATVTVNSYDITTTTIPPEPSFEFETLSLIGIFAIVIILLTILLKIRK